MRVIFTLILLWFAGQVNAQVNLSLYNMKHIPQVVYANPAFIPLGRTNISLPMLGSNYTQLGKSNFNTNVTDVDAQGTLRLNTEKFVNGLENQNTVFATTTIENLYVGFSVGKNYFFLTSNDKITGAFEFPKSMAVFITEVYNDFGINGYHKIENVLFNYTHYREYGLGFSRRINERLNVGFRMKLYSGLASFKTNSTGFVIDNTHTDNNLRGLIDVDIQTSGIENYLDFVEDPLKLVEWNGNMGYGFDIGVDYKINPKIKVAFSALDVLGHVHWKNNIQNFKAENVQIDFSTIDWVDIINPDSEKGFLPGIYDSIVNNTEPTEAMKSFNTQIATKLNGSFTYYLTPKLEATLVSQLAFTKDYMQPSVRIGVQGRLKRFLNYSVSYSLVDNLENPKNLGVGLAVNLSVVQFYALTDNIFDPFLNSEDFNPSLRFGINLTIGRDYE